jgi:hypothetical protein
MLLPVLAAAILAPRIFALDRFVTVDEPRWLARSANFYLAIIQGDFADTYQRAHPGVTTMWLGTAGLLWRFPAYGSSGTGQVDVGEYERILEANGHTLVELLTASRTFVVLCHTVILVLCFVFARRLIGPLPAFVGLLFIAFDPFHVAHSRLLHIDGLLTSLLLLALLAFLNYLGQRRFLDLILSGIAAGLSWLTKSPGLFLIPAVGLVAAVDFWQRLPAQKGTRMARLAWQFIRPLLIWGIVGIAVVTLLWPAMVVNPLGTVSNVITAALDYARTGHSLPVFFGGEVAGEDDLGVSYFYFYLVAYLWRSTPVSLVGLVAALVGLVLKRGPLSRAKVRHAVVGLLLFAAVFSILQTLGAKKFDRYLLPVFLPLDLAAAVGWVAIADRLKMTRLSGLKRYGAQGVLAAVIVVQVVGTLHTFPYYLSYYNPLVGGSRTAPKVMMIGWGEGLDEAARYLSQKPNSRRLEVASWYGRCFSGFFSGTSRRISAQPEMSEAEVQKILSYDYVVIYIHQWQRQAPRQLLDALAPRTPEHSIWINGLEYARIYKLSRVPD